MKYSIGFYSMLIALLTVIGLNILLLIILFSLGNYFHILHSFTWFWYKILALPFSLFVFFFRLVSEIKVKEKRKLVSKDEYKSRMEKYHDS